ncbi:MAG: DUF1800 domain-containing protein [Chitinophagaceae bacterium]|nr:DUF1800 domain-containing protein [Chitinophagaceae bacterium]
MNRRSFLKARRTKKNAVSINTVSGRTSTGLNQYSGSWTKNEVVHLLKRTMFGAKLADIEYFSQKTMEQCVDELLTITSPMPDPPLKDYDTSATQQPDSDVDAGTTWVYSNNPDGDVGELRKASLKKWWIGLMVNQQRNVREKMTLFWHNHFVTEMASTQNALFAYKHHTLLRQNCMGNFKKLARAITIDSLMLVYQNGERNSKYAPDENFARELQELFTLGKENNPNYTEDDVKAAARVLTGWRNDEDANISYFDASRHDTGNKTFSSFYNNKTIQGKSGSTAGDEELDELINMIFSKGAEASRYIVKELYKWFVYYEVDQAAEENVIAPLAQMLQNYNWDIAPVLSALLKSEHFFDVMNQGCLIKSPADFIIGTCREMQLAFPQSSDYTSAYAVYAELLWQCGDMQQSIGDPPSVSGWPAYYQIPTFHEMWINNDTYPKRNQFTDTLVFIGYTTNNFLLKIDAVNFTKSLSNPGDPKMLIEDSLAILYRIQLSDTIKEQLKKEILLTGQTNDYYWTNAWNTYIANPTDMMAYETVHTRLNDLYKYLLALPEYQLS